MKGRLIAAVALVLTLSAAPAALYAVDEEQLDEWRSTVRYGIDSELTDVMDQLQESGTAALNDAIFERYQSTMRDPVRREILSFFTAMEYAGAEEAAREVVAAYRDHSADLVLQALRYLSNAVETPTEASRTAVRSLVENGGNRLSTAAARALGKVGTQEDGDYLLSVVQQRSSSEELRNESILALGALEHDPAVELLIGLATDDDRSITTRRYAVDSLGKIGASSALPALRSLAASQNSILRAQTAAAFGAFARSEVTEILLSLLRDSNAAVRTQALKSLAEHAPRDIGAIRYKAENDPEPSVQSEAMKTLVSIGEESVVADIAAAENHPHSGRMRAVSVLVDAEGGAATRALRSVIEEEWEQATPAMTIQLARTMSQRSELSAATQSLVERLLAHPNQTVQLYAIQAILRAEAAARYRRQLSELADSAAAPAVRSAATQALPEEQGPDDEESAGE